MNAPDSHELFTLPQGKNKVEYEVDSRIEFAGTFTVYLEDHTLGNITRMQLLQDDKVRFAGYKAPHPLEHRIQVRIQTNGQITPHQALTDSLTNLTKTFKTLQSQFETQIKTMSSRS
jgi:DNA-directed RNA polymerase II subunit RPB11